MMRWWFTASVVFAGLSAALGSLGCNLISGVDELAFDRAPTGGTTPPTPCVEPSAGMIVSEDTVLCAGSYLLPVAPGDAAIEIASEGVALVCEGTVIDGGGSPPSMSPDVTIGIRIGADQVTLAGCAVKGYRYGIAAVDVVRPTIGEVVADDNYHDPGAGWVGDVPGGGLLLSGVEGGRVERSSFARNYNGIELRESNGVEIVDNRADHCSNTGAFLLDSSDNLIDDNDFSWAIRGAGLSYPDQWWGIDTKDSSGMILEGSSHGNVVSDNVITHGGNGIFVRDLYGLCPENNLIVGNDTSESPHNGIESWCDRNVLESNRSDNCNFGIWTGGSDHTIVADNLVRGSKCDGISIQIGENRHTLIEGNEVTGSGRAGILVTGRMYQCWEPLVGHKYPSLVNASHIVVQKNALSANAQYDLFVDSAHLVVSAANCSPTYGSNYFFGDDTEPHHDTMGVCGVPPDRAPPVAALAELPPVAPGTKVSPNASASRGGGGGELLRYFWLVQRAGMSFVSGTVTPLLSGEYSATPPPFAALPGIFDVDVTVYDGSLAAMASRTLIVVPTGKKVGQKALEWACTPADACAEITDEPDGLEDAQVHFRTEAHAQVSLVAPATKDLAFDAVTAAPTRLGFFVRAINPARPFPWTWDPTASPVVQIGTDSGIFRYEVDPSTCAPECRLRVLPQTLGDGWHYISIPLAAPPGSGWLRTGTGNWQNVSWIELGVSSWQPGFELWIDGLTFY